MVCPVRETFALGHHKTLSRFMFCLAASVLSCYQCNSTDIENQFQCAHTVDKDSLAPKPCVDVDNARFCVKLTGRYEGLFLEFESRRCNRGEGNWFRGGGDRVTEHPPWTQNEGHKPWSRSTVRKSKMRHYKS